MKFLLITYSYSPDLTPRAFRWSAIANQFAEMGHQVHVLCASSSNIPETNNNIQVFRIKDWLLNASIKVSGTEKINRQNSNTIRELFSLSIKKFVRVIWRAMYWPDYACGWIIPASMSGLKLCQLHKYDWIISVSHPFSGHLVGLNCLKKNKISRWLVDIGDPFTMMNEPSPNNNFIYHRINYYYENKILNKSNAVTVTTDATQSVYEKEFPDLINKVSVINPLLSLPKISPTLIKNEHSSKRMVFVGTLYKNLRSPHFLLECLSALKALLNNVNLEMHFFGLSENCNEELEIAKRTLGASLIVHGLKDRETVMQAMMNADILVNIGNASKSQLASKVIEYISIGKPILNLITIEDDLSKHLLQNYPSKLTVISSVDGPSKNDIKLICDFILDSKPAPYEIVQVMIEEYKIEKITQKYLNILKQFPENANENLEVK